MKKAKQGMQKEVLPFSKIYMSRAIDDIVYSVWDMPPRTYIRRHERGSGLNHGGLNDENNMIGTVVNEGRKSFGFSIENVTMPSSPDAPKEYLTPLIVLGQLGATGQLKYRDGAENYPYGKPRDFIGETARTMRNDKRLFVHILDSYMNNIKY